MLYCPARMALVWILAATPILLVVVLMTVVRWPAARAGLLGLLAAMGLAAAAFGAGMEVQSTALGRGLMMALDVLPIVWGAYLFYRVTAEGGAIAALGEALPALTPSRGLQALVIGWAFASFLQGVGGFGVPVAVTAPILVGLGFTPLTAVLAPSIGHAWAVTFGSLASSLQAMASATGLTPAALAPASALALGVVGVGCGVGVAQAAEGWRGALRLAVPIAGIGAAMGLAHYLLAAHGMWSIAAVGAGLVGVGVGLALARLSGASESAWKPGTLRLLGRGLEGYALLVAVIGLARFIRPLQAVLQRWTVTAALPATATAQGFEMPAAVQRYAPLGHTGTLLLFAALLAFGLLAGRSPSGAGAALRRVVSSTLTTMLPVTLGIIAMVELSAVMEYAGMIRALASGLAAIAGPGFALVSPWIGALGAFVTGSNTSSNLMFATLQARTASLLNLETTHVLALQNVGGALGSVVSPTKVIVAVSTVGLAGQEGRVMRPLAFALALILLWVSLAVGIGLLTAVVQSA
jgi:lactate permease